MQQSNSLQKQFAINEYMLVLNPHEELCKSILKQKEEFAGKYKTGTEKITKPHITLAKFKTSEMMQEKLLRRLQALAMNVTPFKIELKGYGSYPTHTIYINVITRLPIQNLVKEIKTAQHIMKLDKENKPYFIDEPHITVCRKLKPWQYEQGWMEYSHSQFTGRFIANNMLLLKRPAQQNKPYQRIQRFEFLNIPAVRQGNLFA